MSISTANLAPSDAYKRDYDQAVATKKYMNDLKALLLQANVGAEVVLAASQHCRAVIARIDIGINTPGIAEVARIERNDPLYDMVAEMAAWRATLVALRDWVVANFPKDGTGYLLYQQISGDATVTNRQLTAAAVSAVVPLVDAVIAAS